MIAGGGTVGLAVAIIDDKHILFEFFIRNEAQEMKV